MKKSPISRCHIDSLENRRMLAVLPSGFSEQLMGATVSAPTAFAFAPDGRLFITQQGGQLRVVDHGTLQTTPFLSVSTTTTGERGLLGVAFDPDYASNHYVYVYYTVTTPAVHNRVSRFTADPNNQNIALAGSETVLLELNNLSATNHNGGAIHFGPDGKLYIAVGENAVGSNAQSFNNLLGKMLRMNSDGSIPTDNPYFNNAAVIGQNKLIWSLGLRNPFTFAFENGTGRMFINDVGQDTWEEINEGLPHSNYGWPGIEGKRVAQTPPTDYRDPVYVYSNSGSQIAVIGGAFYAPTYPAYPAQYEGQYFFADLGAGWMRTIDPDVTNPTAQNFATGGSTIVGFTMGPDNSVYYLQRSGTAGAYRIRYNETVAPTVTGATFVYDEATPNFETSQRVRVGFSEYVGDSLTASDFVLENLTTASTVPTANLKVRYDWSTNTATLSFPGYANVAGALPNGRYRLTLAAGAATDSSGNPLAASTPFEFSVLAGDTNGDNAVTFDDLLVVSQNYGNAGTYSQGDFNYDGTIGFDDLLILTQNYGTSVLSTSPVRSTRNARLIDDLL